METTHNYNDKTMSCSPLSSKYYSYSPLHHCLNSRCCFYICDQQTVSPISITSQRPWLWLRKLHSFWRAFLGISHTQKSEWQSGLYSHGKTWNGNFYYKMTYSDIFTGYLTYFTFFHTHSSHSCLNARNILKYSNLYRLHAGDISSWELNWSDNYHD